MLLSDSPWHGGRDYFGDRARYFRHDDERDLKSQVATMYYHTPEVYPDHKEWIETNFSDQRMVDDMLRRIAATT